MSLSKRQKSPRSAGELGIVYIAFASVAMIVFTFIVSNLDIGLTAKYLWLSPGVLLYAGFSVFVFLWQRTSIAKARERAERTAFDSDVDIKLAALSDANEFFGASLRPDDLFRLLASRLREIVPFDACVLYVIAAEAGVLRVRCAAGDNARNFSDAGVVGSCLASRAVEKRSVLRDARLETERSAHSPETLEGFASAMASPLWVDGAAFGAMVLYSRVEDGFGGDDGPRFAAAAERIAPLVSSSFSFEKSIDNALTDPVTSLPNERGFFLVLESRIAESHRFRDAKALAVLAMDINGFSDFNESFGHAMGNRLLAHVACAAKSQLRQMDVITRSAGDEFLAILPTASGQVTAEIVERLRKAFEERPFEMDHGTVFQIRLNFGSANVGADGETAQSLLRMARTRKQENKSKEGKVLFFPRESIN